MTTPPPPDQAARTTIATALDTTLFVRDTSGAVPVKVMERLRA